MPKLILISGKARNGKDTAAEYFKNKIIEFGKKVAILHYADLLKYLCKQYFEWDGQKDDKGRTILQYVGTNIVRDRNPDFWVKMADEIITNVLFDKDFIIIPDCRFPNEMDYWQDTDYETISLRMIRTNYESELTKAQQWHISEIALDTYRFNWYIRASSLDELYKQCEYFLKEKVLKDEFETA